jgi:hypothetical protein
MHRWKRYKWPGKVAHTCNSSTQEAEAEESQVWGSPQS